MHQVKEDVVVLVVLVRWHRRAVGAVVCRAVDDEVPGAVEEETGPAAVRRVPPRLSEHAGVIFGGYACGQRDTTYEKILLRT